MFERWIKRHEALIVILLAITVLRIPSLFEPYWYGDEGIYLTLGLAIRRGLTLYRDIHDNKPPLLYLITALAQTQFWLKFVAAGWHLATTATLFRLARLLEPKRKWFPAAAAIVFAALTFLWEGNIANGELFMILPVTAAMLLLWTISIQTGSAAARDQQRRRNLSFVIGFLFSLGFLFKVPAVFDFAAAVVFAVLLTSQGVRETAGKLFSRDTIALVVGFTSPIVFTIIYYASRGAAEPYLRSALLQNIGYLGSWSSGQQDSAATLTQSGLLNRTIALGIATLLLWYVSVRRKFTLSLRFVAVWFLFALYGALLSERPYPHYLIQLAAPAALAAMLFFTQKRRLAKGLLLTLGATIILSYATIKFWHYPIIPYYRNFWDWTLKRKSTPEYFAYFGQQIDRTYRLAKYVRLATQPDDKIFIWGDEPFVYALAQRLPVGRYTVAYHVVDFQGYEETARAIRAEKPKIIVVMAGESRPFPQLGQELAASYDRTDRIDDAIIFRRHERNALVY